MLFVDLILIYVCVLIMDFDYLRVEVVVVGGGCIFVVGDVLQIVVLVGLQILVIDVGGCSLLLGFFESYVYVGLGGVDLMYLYIGYLYGVKDVVVVFCDFVVVNFDVLLLMV